jgi:hypothetical protein
VLWTVCYLHCFGVHNGTYDRVSLRWDTPQHALIDDPDPDSDTPQIWPGIFFTRL